MAMRTFMKSEAASPRVGRPDSIRGRGALSGARAPRPRGTPPIQIEGGTPSLRGKPTAPCRPGRLRAALSFTAAVAVAAALGGCSTFGVSPFPEPIRPPIEAEGEDTAAPEAQAEEAGRYSPTPGVRITRT